MVSRSKMELMRSHCGGYDLISVRLIFTNSISATGNAIASVHPSICLFPLYLQNQLTIDLEHLHVSRSDHSSQGIEG